MISQDLQIESSLEREENLAPQMEFSLPDGTKASLDQFKGNYVLVNFWATWCEPCLEEMPSLRALDLLYKNRGLRVLAINIQETPKEKLEESLEKIALPENTVFNVKRSQISRYQLEGIPFSILINKAGKPIKTFEGSREWTSRAVLAEINQLILK
jgi:thiol-disulfide isomerase/thioredoxin